MSNEKDLVLRDSAFEIQTADLSKNELPSLEDAQELPIDLCGNYWTPEHAGEFKKMFFVEITPQKVLSATNPDELIDLDCATFLEKTVNGTVQTVTNGSRRLVGILEQYLENGSLKSGMPLKITYMGKKKNKTNNFQSDNWSVRPLRLNLPVAG